MAVSKTVIRRPFLTLNGHLKSEMDGIFPKMDRHPDFAHSTNYSHFCRTGSKNPKTLHKCKKKNEYQFFVLSY